jgi:16S rRNA (uracil1498-N3)-methyltransferase
MTSRSRRALHRPGGSPGDRIVLSPEESAHLCRVLRLGRSDRVSVFDGAGREWDARIEVADPHGVEVLVGNERTDRVEPTVDVILVQAICRPERLEWAFQKSAEIGVAGVMLFRGERTDVGAPSPSRWGRWERILAEACKQSGRRVIPELRGPVAAPVELPAGVLGIFLHPGGSPVERVLRDRGPQATYVAVGPEGGFSEEERDAWLRSGWVQAALGPRILRAETAGPVAISIVLHTWGDLGAG